MNGDQVLKSPGDTASFSTELYDLLAAHFNHDRAKIHKWMTTRNPLLGNVEPIVLCMLGKEDKVLKFVKNAKEGNWP